MYKEDERVGERGGGRGERGESRGERVGVGERGEGWGREGRERGEGERGNVVHASLVIPLYQ